MAADGPCIGRPARGSSPGGHGTPAQATRAERAHKKSIMEMLEFVLVAVVAAMNWSMTSTVRRPAAWQRPHRSMWSGPVHQHRIPLGHLQLRRPRPQPPAVRPDGGRDRPVRARPGRCAHGPVAAAGNNSRSSRRASLSKAWLELCTLVSLQNRTRSVSDSHGTVESTVRIEALPSRPARPKRAARRPLRPKARLHHAVTCRGPSHPLS